MEIRSRLTLQFSVIVAIILILAEFSIYLFSEFLWKEDFNDRLQSKAYSLTNLLVDVEGIDADILRLIEKNNLSTLPYEEIHLFNESGAQIFSSQDSSALIINPALIHLIREKNQVNFNQGRYTVVGFQYQGVHDRITVIAGAIDIYGLRKLANLRSILLVVFLASLLFLFLTGRVYSNRALRPILKVIGEVPAITGNTMHLRVNEGNGRDEVARLAQTFNSMLDRLELAFKVQQSFIANASHEIRTPLAHMRGQMEVALIRERSSQEYISLVESVLEDIVKLGDMADRLLLLMMTSSDSNQIEMNAVRIDDLLWETQSALMESYSGYKVIIQFKTDFTEDAETDVLLTLRGNDQLLRIVLKNLMENGCKYSGDHMVRVTIENAGPMILVRFRDEGIGIPAEDQPFIFEPFYRAGNVESVGGTGLGLSLVRQITEIHGGTITLQSVAGEGSEFTLSLPVLNHV